MATGQTVHSSGVPGVDLEGHSTRASGYKVQGADPEARNRDEANLGASHAEGKGVVKAVQKADCEDSGGD